MFGGGGGMPYIRCAGRKRAPADATPAICNKKAVGYRASSHLQQLRQQRQSLR